ncbi:DMT family transporter [Aggregicoccus sp. 17bor-14]|nr:MULTISPECIES: DMT family transporter [Myxococcaceae]MBF5041012.1 DMT family transporter [Simulacricoccus sp. 17bor-14]MRI86798.1 DMT family transporter [Aggregicoccus sp. 17bor-14]
MLGVVLVWGSNYVIVKASLDAFAPLAFMALRFSLAAFAMLALLLWREGWPRLSAALWGRLLLLGLVGNTLYQLCFILGLSRTTAANSGMLSALTPVLVMVLGGVLGLERFTRPLVFGLLLAVSGVLLVVSARGPSLSAETRSGDLLIVGGCVCWALYTVGVRALGQGLSPLAVTALTMLTGAPALAVVGAPAVAAMHLTDVSALAWTGVVYSALVPLVLGYVVWNRSVHAVGSSRTGLYNAGIPIAASLTAWLARGERPTAVQGVGALLILAGVALSRRR